MGQYQQYFWAKEQGNVDQLKANEPKRVELCKAVAAVARAFANLSNEMTTTGYTKVGSDAFPVVIENWEQKLEISVPKWTIRRMKTKWGSCNRETRHLWFNVELVKKHPDCLEYTVVHEMAHYFERNYGERFTKLMNKYLLDWCSRRDQLNGAPLAEAT